jgi:hypothetical protein
MSYHHPFQASAQVRRFYWSKEIVILHQTIAKKAETIGFSYDCQLHNEPFTVVGLMKDIPPAVTVIEV